MVVTLAHESITTYAPVSDRSQETARSAVEVAQALLGSGEAKSFGWSRREKREGLFAGEVAQLRARSLPFAPPGIEIASQGEHDVFYQDGAAYVHKVTNGSAFGYVVDQESDNRANKLTLRRALPSEYLTRQGIHNIAFGDDAKLQAIGTDKRGFPMFVIAQPYADNTRPFQAEINAFMEQSGFVRLPDEMLMQSLGVKPVWWRAADQLIATDANPENFSKLSDTEIVPIDLIVHNYPASLLESTARQNGVRLA